MGRLSSIVRITIGLACLSVTVLFCAQTVGLVPDRQSAVLKGRTQLCEALAINCSVLASRNDMRALKTTLDATLARNTDMLYARVRRREGTLLVDVERLAPATTFGSPQPADIDHIDVPIIAGNQPWGSVDIGFRPVTRRGLRGLLDHPVFRLAAFVGIASLFVYFIYLRRLLQDLDPTKVIPDRVHTTLDTFAEGLLVLDHDGRIVMANKSFAQTIGRSVQDLQGRQVADLPWARREVGSSTAVFPWQRALSDGKPDIGKMLDLRPASGSPRTFMVNASPILGDGGETRGALASFDDVTAMEKHRVELHETLTMLKKSRDEVHRKNIELQDLASHDPLTACLNRRSFFEQFETQWSNSRRHSYALAYVMVDIDHFKAVNDTHGHQVGDEVLRKVASVLKSAVRTGDIVCRYGGEEFGVMLPHLDVAQAHQAAERYRQAICATPFSNLAVTASFGVSTSTLGAESFQELIDQADKCLYVAKRNGRNQVCRWDEVPDDVEAADTMVTDIVPSATADVAIPFHAVTALISALSYRDTGTAEHSRRVADLCIRVAGHSMSTGEAYVLETAALLHDIGKIGVPDSILLKPGPLTDEEWQVMQIHDRIGVEIIKSAFACTALTDIIQNHHAWYGGGGRNKSLPRGTDIPLGARILTIADAFDAMVSDRVYRQGRSTEEAFLELRRCAGTQFDPDLVELFIETVLARDEQRVTRQVTVSKQTALRIGLQIEDLATAMDKQDVEGLAALADRLHKTAAKYGVTRIADVAQQLLQQAKEDTDQMKLAELTSDLLDLCRSTQTAYLGDSADDDGAEEELLATSTGR